ncbi:MAG: flavodoxin domain-containing protein [Proteobacteria bacterium]|nr:nitric oxide synthase [Desulfobacteraceae bacterium]MBU4318550.1 flavodoxin domain-containing protein [Pseudomonadota bacterium]MBU4470377.1 flavodoxin domain-containing protein [Pseudomonadota bacterium]MCG2753912.1 flavodoxin domain-containing protein [Desulfobacteraceae bacterium]
MKKALVCYSSRTGKTEKMANFIAEGLRITGITADIQKIADIKDEKQMEGYDGYVFGCPTYHRDMTAGMKTFLFTAEKLNLVGKIGGAFGSYTHSGESAPMVFDTMQYVYKMDMTDLGALSLKEAVIETAEGAKACQDYGKAIGAKL